MKTSSPRVWFITGTSQGFGQELVRAALERGDSVVATSRTPQKVEANFLKYTEQLLPLQLDLNDVSQIEKAVAAAIAKFGHIDVLVNNAGYGFIGAVEEASEAEISNLFQINFFGLLRVTKAILPHFRERRGGHIVNLSSIAGLTGFAGFGIYNATKFAVEGMSQALAQEVALLGIHVTLVEPGGFRTGFLGKSSLNMASNVIGDYQPTAGATRLWQKHDGKQLGDPVLGAHAIIQAVTSEHPPLHLLLGRDACERAAKHIQSLTQEFEQWREVSCSTDFKK